MQCDMCGARVGSLLKAEIEGTLLDVCRDCAKFGRIVSQRRAPPKRPAKVQRRRAAESTTVADDANVYEVIVSDFARRIKNARERLGLKQIQFAKRISEKESVVQKLESGHLKPSVAMAQKLQRFLHIKLIDNIKEEAVVKGAPKSDAFTLGDFIKVKKRK